MSNKRKIKIGIYKITNKVNDKAYIGQSVDIEKRWKRHINDSKNPNKHSYNYPICCALRKYGIENFNFEILEECNKNLLDEREIYWISYFDTYLNGYNQGEGGESNRKTPTENVLAIINDLENTTLSAPEIAKNRDVSRVMVDNINTGRAWRQQREYPIRDMFPHKQKTYCLICGKEISKNCSYCLECYNKRKEEKLENTLNKIMPKDKLLTLILQYSFVQIGEMYDVSDNTIRNWCKRYDLPYKQNDINLLRQKNGIKKNSRKTVCHTPNNAKKIIKCDLLGAIIESYESITAAGQSVVDDEKYNSNIDSARRHIGYCCRGKRKSAYGYIWKFADEN